MLWWRRSLVLGAVLSFLAAALVMSCGGGSSTPTTFPPVVLQGIAVCEGSPPTPTPTSSTTPRPTLTPTPMCTPVAISTAVCIPGATTSFCVSSPVPTTALQFNAQGTFNVINGAPANDTFHDVTFSSLWASLATGNPDFTGQLICDTTGSCTPVTAGCTCVSASDGGLLSPQVLVGINEDASSCPTQVCP